MQLMYIRKIIEEQIYVKNHQGAVTLTFEVDFANVCLVVKVANSKAKKYSFK